MLYCERLQMVRRDDHQRICSSQKEKKVVDTYLSITKTSKLYYT